MSRTSSTLAPAGTRVTAREDARQGPVTRAALRQLYAKGTVHGQTLVWAEPMLEPQPFDSVRELRWMVASRGALCQGRVLDGIRFICFDFNRIHATTSLFGTFSPFLQGPSRAFPQQSGPCACCRRSPTCNGPSTPRGRSCSRCHAPIATSARLPACRMLRRYVGHAIHVFHLYRMYDMVYKQPARAIVLIMTYRNLS